MGNLTTLCSGCHEDIHGHPIFAGGDSYDSGGSSEINIFSLGIQNLWSDTDATSDTVSHGNGHNSIESHEVETFGDAISIGAFLTAGLFVFMSLFWIALFDGEGFLFSIGVLVVILPFLGIPLLIISGVAGTIPALVISGLEKLLTTRGGDELSETEVAFYVAASLSFVIFFNISLLRASFTEATLVSSVWSATLSAVFGGLLVIFLTRAFLWWLFLPSSEDRE